DEQVTVGAGPCPPHARKRDHPRRFTVIHGATNTAPDLWNRGSCGRGHLLCKVRIPPSAARSTAHCDLAATVTAAKTDPMKAAKRALMTPQTPRRSRRPPPDGALAARVRRYSSSR